MAKFKYELTLDKIEKFKKEGRGKGELEKYKPWITIRDLSSNGRSSREFGVKTNREHHLLSDLERYFFYIIEWNGNIIDIREQYPILDRSKTMEIAEILGYKHPMASKTKINAVITVDFYITYRKENGELVYIARSIKPFNQKEINRNLFKSSGTSRLSTL